MTATCGCGHPHKPGMTHCYTCGLPIDVPPGTPPQPGRATALLPAHAAIPPVSPAGRRAQSLRDRLFSRLVIDQDTGCLLWTGPKTHKGYGRIRVGSQKRWKRVHRLMWELLEGPIPDGLQLDHLCRVRHCASIAHLEPVTPRENNLRGVGFAAINAAKTHCPCGRQYDLFTDRRRRCSTCRNRSGPQRRAAKATPTP